MSAIMDRGIVRLSASVPINDEVRKQPLKRKKRKQAFLYWKSKWTKGKKTDQRLSYNIGMKNQEQKKKLRMDSDINNKVTRMTQSLSSNTKIPNILVQKF